MNRYQYDEETQLTKVTQREYKTREDVARVVRKGKPQAVIERFAKSAAKGENPTIPAEQEWGAVQLTIQEIQAIESTDRTDEQKQTLADSKAERSELEAENDWLKKLRGRNGSKRPAHDWEALAAEIIGSETENAEVTQADIKKMRRQIKRLEERVETLEAANTDNSTASAESEAGLELP